MVSHPIFKVGSDGEGPNQQGVYSGAVFQAYVPLWSRWIYPMVFGHTPTGKNELKTSFGRWEIDYGKRMGKGLWASVTASLTKPPIFCAIYEKHGKVLK